MHRRGVILAGGTGSRLWPLTSSINKHLLPVHDKPMIYYSLSTLMLAGVRDIAIVTTNEAMALFKGVLREGEGFGVNIQYFVQENPMGIADALRTVGVFLQGESSLVTLGDNFLFGSGTPKIIRSSLTRESGSTVFTYRVNDPSAFGVLEKRDGTILSIEEKPMHPKSNQAITGLYAFDGTLTTRLEEVSMSKRGEFEISDILNSYLGDSLLSSREFPRGSAWLDLGTLPDLARASAFVESVQSRQGYLVGSPEEIGIRNGWVTWTEASKYLTGGHSSPYANLLREVMEYWK